MQKPISEVALRSTVVVQTDGDRVSVRVADKELHHQSPDIGPVSGFAFMQPHQFGEGKVVMLFGGGVEKSDSHLGNRPVLLSYCR